MELEEVRRIYRPSALWSQKPLVSHSEFPADKSIDFSLDLWSLCLQRTPWAPKGEIRACSLRLRRTPFRSTFGRFACEELLLH